MFSLRDTGHEELFAEEENRLKSLVIGTLKDETFLKESEVAIGLRRGTIKKIFRYRVVQFLESIDQTLGGYNRDRNLGAHELGLAVQMFTGVDRDFGGLYNTNK